MAKVPTPEESGRRILGIYKTDGTRPGEMISWPSLQTRFVTGEWRAVDFQAGLRWCVDEGYLEEKKRKMDYYLTDAGFAVL